jgi:hypothetical protein
LMTSVLVGVTVGGSMVGMATVAVGATVLVCVGSGVLVGGTAVGCSVAVAVDVGVAVGSGGDWKSVQAGSSVINAIAKIRIVLFVYFI